ncbi:MAG: hypothetical protein KatS3mg022_1214 [Armatimonadota bacterium]|nr:MAG: hypothetical protein KatS3mg022_1214 [Armatimonadota bacterium]
MFTRRYGLLCILASVIMLMLITNGWTQRNGNSSSQDASVPVRFVQILQQLSSKMSDGLLAECYYSDELLMPPNATALRSSVDIQSVAAAYHREIVRTGNTYIVRPSPQAPPTFGTTFKRKQEQRNASLFPSAWWRGTGYDQMEIRARKSEEGVVRVFVKAIAVPLSTFCERFSKETGWQLQVEPELQAVRIFAKWQSVSPGEVVEAISLLLRSEVQVSFSRSAEQKQAEQRALEEEASLAEQAKATYTRAKYTEQLLPELLSELTPEELERFQQGQEVEVPVSRLSSGLQDRALRFAADLWDALFATMEPQSGEIFVREHLRECEPVLLLPTLQRSNLGIRFRNPSSGEEYVL